RVDRTVLIAAELGAVLERMAAPDGGHLGRELFGGAALVESGRADETGGRGVGHAGDVDPGKYVLPADLGFVVDVTRQADSGGVVLIVDGLLIAFGVLRDAEGDVENIAAVEGVGVVEAAAARGAVEAVRFDALERRAVGPIVLIGEAVIVIPLPVETLLLGDYEVVAVDEVGEPVVVPLAAVVEILRAVRLHETGGVVGGGIELVVELDDGVLHHARGQDVIGERRARYVAVDERGRARIVNDVLRRVGGDFEQR